MSKDGKNTIVTKNDDYVKKITDTEEISFNLTAGALINKNTDTLLTNANHSYSEYINIENLEELLVSGNLGKDSAYIFYDENKVKISFSDYVSLGITADVQFNNVVLSIPNGTHYMRFSTRVGSTAKVEKVKEELKHYSHQELYEMIKSNSSDMYDKSKITIRDFNFAEIRLEGTLPTDLSVNRTPTEMEMKLKIDNKTILYCKTEVSIQGNGSAKLLKKGYTLDLINASDEELELKIGNDISVSSFHLKGHYTDISHTRDVGNGRLWSEIAATRDFPLNFLSPIPDSTKFKNNISYTQDAKYFTNGRPVAVYLNSEFLGLYTLRLKKERDNYCLNKDDQNNIFLDAATFGAKMGNRKYNSYDEIAVNASPASEVGDAWWEVRTPKKPTDETKSKVVALFDFFYAMYNTSGYDVKTNFPQHINVISAIDYLIIMELIWHWDTNGNNTNLITYDGQIWSFFLYDTDQTGGLQGLNIHLTKSDWLVNYDIWVKFKSAYSNEIKSRYTYLRNTGVLSMINFKKIYGGISSNIPRNVYKNDFEKWGARTSSIAIPDINQLYIFLKSRLDFLDKNWII